MEKTVEATPVLELEDVLGLRPVGEATEATSPVEKIIWPLSITESKFKKLVKTAGFKATEKNAVIGTRLVLCALIFANMPREEQLKAVTSLPLDVRTFALGINSKK